VIHLVTALPAEARPLVSHYRLVGPVATGPFRIYQGADVSLVVSGPGSAACARAVKHLLEFQREAGQRVWVNVGIAGHRDWAVGTAAVAHEVVEAASGRAWSLKLPRGLESRRARVCTVTQVEHDYPLDALYDMEAAGFCSALGAEDLPQVLKVVSDNRAEGPGSVNARKVHELIESAIASLDELMGCI